MWIWGPCHSASGLLMARAQDRMGDQMTSCTGFFIWIFGRKEPWPIRPKATPNHFGPDKRQQQAE
ncbi:hypothetical protein LEMLEM_LOCUS20108, partial [Lemmus lemmus]